MRCYEHAITEALVATGITTTDIEYNQCVATAERVLDVVRHHSDVVKFPRDVTAVKVTV